MEKEALRDYGNAESARGWKLRLYVTNQTPRCVVAYRNLKKICQEHIRGKVDIEVIDILENPEVARQEQIVAIPTLIKISPEPKKLLVGDFSKLEQVLEGLHAEPRVSG